VVCGANARRRCGEKQGRKQHGKQQHWLLHGIVLSAAVINVHS
jgi:hypothetical protein